MKKVLIATTALVASAGFAAADVALSGDGRMGVTYDGDDWGYTSRARVAFTLSGETDNGIAFGGSLRADNAGGASSGKAGSVFVSGGFGKLSMGDVDSAAKAAVGDISGVGLTGLGDYNELQYLLSASENENGNSEISAAVRPSALYEYNTGAFGIYLGTSNPFGFTSAPYDLDLDGDGINDYTDVTLDVDTSYSAGVSYAGDFWAVAAGYETAKFTLTGTDQLLQTVSASSTEDAWYIGGEVTFGDATVKANYSQGDIIDTQYGISLDYVLGATTLTGFWSHRELGDDGILGAASGDKTDRWGVGASYDLGGGASLVAGVASLESDEVADFGIKFSF